MHFLFNTCWVNGAICKDFKKNSKIVLPKAGKDDFNKVRVYRPIMLESVIEKSSKEQLLKDLDGSCGTWGNS